MPRKKQIIAHKKRLRVILAVASVLIIAAVLILILSRRQPRPVNLQSVADLSPNIHYCNDKNPSRVLDLYRPKLASSGKRPLIVYVHGGAWRWGDKRNKLIKNYGPRFIEKGFVVASLNYRLNSKNPYPDQNDDVACALAYLTSNADTYGIDPKQTIFFGDSAGGQLAAFAALNIPYKQYDYEAPVGVIDFYGVTDFLAIVNGPRPDFNARRYLGSKYNKVASAASPTTYVTKHAPYFLILHGTKDKVVPIEQSRTLYDALIKAGVDAKYVTLPGINHAFIGPELSQANNKLILDNLDAFLSTTTGR